MTWSYKKQRRLLQLAAQSKSPEAIANLMDRSPEKNRPRSTPTERLKAVRASASAGGKLGGLARMMNGMKQALLVIGSTMALIVVGPSAQDLIERARMFEERAVIRSIAQRKRSSHD